MAAGGGAAGTTHVVHPSHPADMCGFHVREPAIVVMGAAVDARPVPRAYPDYRKDAPASLPGHGAGTWARYEKAQPRPYRAYYAHMHNLYLDLMFEHGVVFVALLLAACAAAVLRVCFLAEHNRLWLFYLAGVAVMALGQHLFYAFSTVCLLLPGLVGVPYLLGVRPSGSRANA